MSYLRNFTGFLAFLCAWPVLAAEPTLPKEDPHLPARIDAIEVQGLTRTNLGVVTREIPFRAGQVVSQDEWDFAILRLWNLNLFDTIDAHVDRDPKTHRSVAIFKLRERWTLIPLIAFGDGGGVGFLQLGAADTNLAGRYVTLGAKYERFAVFDGFQVWLRDPRLMHSMWDALVMGEQLVRPRQDYADRRLRLATELGWQGWRDRLRAAWRLTLQRNTMVPRDGSDPGPDPPHIWSREMELGLRIGRIDTVRLREGGSAVEVRLSINANDPNFTNHFAQVWLEGQMYAMPGERWNLAARLQAAAQGNAPIPLQFYVGGLELVRGYPDSAVRTDRYAVLNAEARFIAWDWHYLALMPAVFVDAGLAGRQEGGVKPMLSAGGGVRVLFPTLVESGIRLDFATPLLKDACPGSCQFFSVGVYQFFDGILTPERR